MERNWVELNAIKWSGMSFIEWNAIQLREKIVIFVFILKAGELQLKESWNEYHLIFVKETKGKMSYIRMTLKVQLVKN